MEPRRYAVMCRLAAIGLLGLGVVVDPATAQDTVGYWRFEPADLRGDSSGHRRGLEVVGPGVEAGPIAAPASVPATGEANLGAAVFSGYGAVRVPSAGVDVLGFPDGQDFTFECWLTTGDSVGVNVLLSKVREDPDVPGTRSHGFDFLTIPGRGVGPATPLHFRIYTRNDGLIYLLRVDDAIAPRGTYHLALAREGVTYNVYIDGELRGQADSDATIASDGDLFIGTLGLGDRPFGGHYLPADARVDEARLTARALLPNEFLLFPRPGTVVRRIDFGPRPAAGWEPPDELQLTRHSETLAVDPARLQIDGDSPRGPNASAQSGLIGATVRLVPGVYDVRLHFCEVDPVVTKPGQRVFDLAVNGHRVVRKLDIVAAGGALRPLVREAEGVACPDGRLRLELLSGTDHGPLLNALEVIAASGRLERVIPAPGRATATGWEVAMPTVPRLIPDPVRLEVTVHRGAVAPPSAPYVSSQPVAPYPERLNATTRKVVRGVGELAPDRQEPLPNGIRYLPGKDGWYEIHHRRAGCRCGPGAVFSLRMEKFAGLATIALGVEAEDRFARLDEFERRAMEVLPGRVRYELHHAGLQLAVDVEAVAPAATPFYGLLARIRVRNEATRPRRCAIVALAAAGNRDPGRPSDAPPTDQPFLVLDTPRPNPPVNRRRPDSPTLLSHDTDYDVLVGFDGDARTAGGTTVRREVDLPPNGDREVYLTAAIDSPGYDENGVRERIGGFFAGNPDLPAEVQARMVQEAVDTWAGIVVGGDAAFARCRDDDGAQFDAAVKAWERGVYSDRPVRFELPDKKLQALANLVANDLFPGIVQPPGLVHDAKYGDTWNYIFCYRHVHAASDLGLERAALDYLRLLSCNQKPDGRISSVRGDFRTDGHGTRFDASYIDALHHYFRWTGDRDAVRELWGTITRAAAHIETSLDPDGDHLYRDLIHQWKSDFDNRGPSSSYQTAIVYRAYRDLAAMAVALGETADADAYRDRAERIRDAANERLWSDELGLMASRGPLGTLRPHPQSLEVEMPVWTGLADPYQAVALTEWYLSNLGMRDDQGGLWMYDNDWWPVVWSQHMGSPGDEMMVAWALLQCGRFEEGCRILQTVAAGSFRHSSPGFAYTFDEHGVLGGNDPATAQGAFGRALVEGLFGVEPHADRGYLVVRPRFPRDWDHARFERPGLRVEWRREGLRQTLEVRTDPQLRVRVELPAEGQVKPAPGLVLRPDIDHVWKVVELPPGGGVAVLEETSRRWAVDAADKVAPGETFPVRVTGPDGFRFSDPFSFFEVVRENARGLSLKLRRAGAGQAVAFVRCGREGAGPILPLVIKTLPATALEAQKRTVLDPLPEDSRYVPVDLAESYNTDIQTCFRQRWQWDASDTPGGVIRYWTMPLFELRHTLPREVKVGDVPFMLGPMGPGEEQPDLLMLANTPPRELPTGATFRLGRRCHKVFLLSLNMHLPQKCYVPAAEVILRYGDGTEQQTLLIPPLNFDSFYQDFAIDTVALPLPAKPSYGMTEWVRYGSVDLAQHHLTMTAFSCEPSRLLESVTVRSLETETFIAIAGLTLAEVVAQE